MAEKKYYVLKLLPPRPTFAFDMNDEERAVMQKHIAYWAEYLQKGIAVVYGPVNDPKGPYGIGIVEVDSEEDVKQLIANDPAAKINTYDVAPMFRAILRK